MGIAIGWFVSQGWTVCVPLTDSQEYDLVIDSGAGLKKVQVKTTKYRVNSYEVELRTKGGNKTGTGKVKHIDWNQIDFLFVLTEEGTKYFIPSNAIKHLKTMLSLGKAMEQFKV